MSINPGDIVKFLNDTGGGIVKKILSNELVLVETSDSFEYPVPAKEIIVIKKAEVKQTDKTENENKPAEKTYTKPKEVKKEEVEYKKDDKTSLIFAFTKTDNTFTSYLLNDSNHFIFYNIVERGKNGLKKIDADGVEPNTMTEIKTFTRDNINSLEEVIVQILFHSHKYDVLKEQLKKIIHIKPVNFFNDDNYIENEYFDDKAYMFLIYKDELGLGKGISSNDNYVLDPGKDIDENEEDNKTTSKPHKKAKTIEVDLHINQLIDSVVGMSNYEILQIQMKHFHDNLTKAIEEKASEVVFIHGIGNGTLKSSIRESISKQYKLHYEDASFKKYGFGATIVLL